jgi:hypothetical protein
MRNCDVELTSIQLSLEDGRIRTSTCAMNFGIIEILNYIEKSILMK